MVPLSMTLSDLADPDLKVTIFFDIEYLIKRHETESYYCWILSVRLV